MPDPKIRSIVSPNREAQCEYAANAKKLNFREARRLKGYCRHVYAALIAELQEAGCLTSATHFANMVQKEVGLLESQIIHDLVSDTPPFLQAIFDLVIGAERSARSKQCSGQLTALQLLYKLMCLLEEQAGDKYNWLLVDVYDIIEREMHCFRMDEAMHEIRSRIFYKYGQFMDGKAEKRIKVMHVLKLAANLSKGECWAPDSGNILGQYRTLHGVVVERLSRLHLLVAGEIVNKNPEAALANAKEAMMLLGEVGLTKNKLLICKAELALVDLLLESERFDAAQRQLRCAERRFMGDPSPPYIELKCKLLIQKGICYYNTKQYDTAMTHLREAYAMSRDHKLDAYDGEVLLQLAKVHAKRGFGEYLARKTYKMARQSFRAAGAHEREKQVNYLVAKLEADALFPNLLILLKGSESGRSRFCEMHSLREWKQRCEPFWHYGRSAVTKTLNVTPSNDPRESSMVAQQEYAEEHGEDIVIRRTERDVACIMREPPTICISNMPVAPPRPPSLSSV